MKILLVEDNEANRDMLARRLRRRGFEVCVAVDGEEGVAMAVSEAPDLILMDIDLPRKSGWDATREIREVAGLENLPIIALTAHAMAADRARSLEAGCSEYETKPIDFDRLLGKIGALAG